MLPNSCALNALRPTAHAGILPILGRRIGQRWRATRAPAGRHTARATFPREGRQTFGLPVASCAKRIGSVSVRSTILQPTFWDENHLSYTENSGFGPLQRGARPAKQAPRQTNPNRRIRRIPESQISDLSAVADLRFQTCPPWPISDFRFEISDFRSDWQRRANAPGYRVPLDYASAYAVRAMA